MIDKPRKTKDKQSKSKNRYRQERDPEVVDIAQSVDFLNLRSFNKTEPLILKDQDMGNVEDWIVQDLIRDEDKTKQKSKKKKKKKTQNTDDEWLATITSEKLPKKQFKEEIMEFAEKKEKQFKENRQGKQPKKLKIDFDDLLNTEPDIYLKKIQEKINRKSKKELQQTLNYQIQMNQNRLDDSQLDSSKQGINQLEDSQVFNSSYLKLLSKEKNGAINAGGSMGQSERGMLSSNRDRIQSSRPFMSQRKNKLFQEEGKREEYYPGSVLDNSYEENKENKERQLQDVKLRNEGITDGIKSFFSRIFYKSKE